MRVIDTVCVMEQYFQVKSDKRDYKKTNLTLRLKETEAVRYYNVLDAAMERNRHVEKSDVNRELLGLVPPKILTKEEIEYFRKGKEK